MTLSCAKLAGLSLLCLTVLMLIRTVKQDFSPAVRVASGLLFVGVAVGLIAPLVAFLQKNAAGTTLTDGHVIVLKALGLAYLSHFMSGVCRDGGEEGLAQKVEMTGKLEILLISLPLFDDVFSLIREILTW